MSAEVAQAQGSQGNTDLRPRAPRYRRWCWTDFKNSYENAPKIYQKMSESYLVRGIWGNPEKCPETGKFHWQCYGEFFDKVPMKYIQECVGYKCHCENTKGSAGANIRYCSKPDTRWPGCEPFQFGESGEQKGGQANVVWKEVKKMIDENKTDTEIAEVYPHVIAMYSHGVEKIRNLKYEIPTPNYLYPFDFANEIFWEPEWGNRQNHRMYVKPSQWGFNAWLKSMEGYHIDIINKTTYGFGEQITGAHLIVINCVEDIDWEFIELTTDVHHHKVIIPHCRHQHRYWRPRQIRRIFWILNPVQFDKWKIQRLIKEERFTDRFKIVHLT